MLCIVLQLQRQGHQKMKYCSVMEGVKVDIFLDHFWKNMTIPKAFIRDAVNLNLNMVLTSQAKTSFQIDSVPYSSGVEGLLIMGRAGREVESRECCWSVFRQET